MRVVHLQAQTIQLQYSLSELASAISSTVRQTLDIVSTLTPWAGVIANQIVYLSLWVPTILIMLFKVIKAVGSVFLIALAGAIGALLKVLRSVISIAGEAIGSCLPAIGGLTSCVPCTGGLTSCVPCTGLCSLIPGIPPLP